MKKTILLLALLGLTACTEPSTYTSKTIICPGLGITLKATDNYVNNASAMDATIFQGSTEDGEVVIVPRHMCVLVESQAR